MVAGGPETVAGLLPPAAGPPSRADLLAGLAVRALREEARLGPKPGLVDGQDNGAHDDMDLPLLLASAEALRPAFRALASARSRAEVGRIGRAGERAMLRATGGVNTHRGALWALGLLVATASRSRGEQEAARRAGRLAALPDPCPPEGPVSHGEQVWRRYGARGARGEAAKGFPHVVGVALPCLRRARAAGLPEETARLDALLAVMSRLPDTCVLHRGGLAGLRAVRLGAARVLAEGGAGCGPLTEFGELLRARRLSPGGSGDLLAAALFLDLVPWEVSACGP
ncbi:triphosphoribosyl-dephospho-CoA synthase [Sphaerisporangium sp. B11E5]|uniref:triphosphoribosyl-dephospho-CoA synthase n=1 Tax=Sphaerisporangium sp. B11E5 TaxID=3153563 RepID=UPI00325E4AB1